MKKIIVLFSVIVVLFSACFAITGCQSSPQTVAYQSAGTLSAAVPVAMAAWDAYVKAGLSTTNQEIAVRADYEKYQAAFAVACDAGAIYAARTTQAQAALTAAIGSSTQSISDLETLIKSFGVTF
jgi:hypothetical protein